MYIGKFHLCISENVIYVT